MERVNLFLLHGFLGRPGDWKFVKNFIPQTEGLRIFTPDLQKEPSLTPVNTLEQWGSNFNRWVEMNGCVGQTNIFAGYSMGGRLGLHALEDRPALWDKALFISTNPGFNDHLNDFKMASEERSKRWLNDCYWAEEFLNASWENLIKNWNASAVFEGSETEPLRLESEYSRELLGLMLTQWSLAQQKNFRDMLGKNLSKVQWLVGELDDKFVDMAKALEIQVPGLASEVLDGASHRVIFDRPREVAAKLVQLMAEVT